MTWTYDAATFSESSATGRRNIVRLVIGDTNTNEQQLQDEEIDYFLDSVDDSVYQACLRAVRALIAKYSREGDIWMGHTRVERSQRVRNYRTLLEKLETDGSQVIAEMYAGGLSISEKTDLAEDSDAVQPAFKIGMDDLE